MTQDAQPDLCEFPAQKMLSFQVIFTLFVKFSAAWTRRPACDLALRAEAARCLCICANRVRCLVFGQASGVGFLL
ncbi:MAG: hypothetical protein CMJ47_01810 [Planctomyces sp.]|nr:hypothetical protein [Planctomyces sp.]